MKKDNLVFALTGVVIGIILGVLIGNVSVGSQPAATAAAPPQQQEQTAANDESQQLPKGHPPIDNSELFRQLEEKKAILAQNPNDLQGIITVANLSYDLKQYDQAVAYYEQAVQKDPKNVNLLTDLGTSYYYVKNPQKALEFYGRTLDIDPKHAQTLMNTGVVKMSMGDKRGAADAWEQLVTLHPEFPEANRLKESIKELRASS